MDRQTRRQLAAFFIITFAFSWLIWLPGVFLPELPIPGMVLQALGALGPTIAALALTWRWQGRVGLKQILARSFGAGCRWRFLFGASLLHLALLAASRGLYGLFSSNLPTSEMLTSPLAIVPLFVMMLFIGGGLDEEIG